MLAKVEVADREEADQIRRGLEDPEVRAFVRIVGALRKLPSERAAKRVLKFVADSLDKQRGSFE